VGVFPLLPDFLRYFFLFISLGWSLLLVCVNPGGERRCLLSGVVGVLLSVPRPTAPSVAPLRAPGDCWYEFVLYRSDNGFVSLRADIRLVSVCGFCRVFGALSIGRGAAYGESCVCSVGDHARVGNLLVIVVVFCLGGGVRPRHPPAWLGSCR